MPNYTSNLGLTLPIDGETSWGPTVDNGITSLIEQAVSGYVTQAITNGADTVITIPNGATGVARNMYLELTGALTATRNLIVPANKKLYFIYNNTTGGFAVTVKVTGQTGVVVASQQRVVLACNGTDVVTALNTFTGSSGGGGGGGGGGSWVQTADEITAGVTPTNTSYAPLDIRRYGAIGDNGTTDCTTPIANALKVAKVTGTMIYVPAASGYYKISNASLTIPTNCGVKGDGFASQIYQSSAEMNVFSLVANSGSTTPPSVGTSNDCRIEGVYLRGTGATTGSAFENYNGVYASGVRNLKVRDIYASGWLSSGVQIRDCTNYEVSGCIIFGCNAGSFNSQSDIVVYSMTAGSRGIITNNFCLSNTAGNHIYVNALGNDSEIVVSNNVCYALSNTFAEIAEGSVTIRYGILISYNNGNAGRVTVDGNVVRYCKNSGIIREGTQGYPVVISNNYVSYCGWDTVTPDLSGCILISSGCPGDLITGNVCSDFRGIDATIPSNAGQGLIVTTGSNGTKIIGNTCDASYQHGIVVKYISTNAEVTNNTITNCNKSEIVVLHTASNSSLGGHLIKDNKIVRKTWASSQTYPGIFLSLQAGLLPTYLENNFITGQGRAVASVLNAGIYSPQNTYGSFYARYNTIRDFYVGVQADACNNSGTNRGSIPNILRNSFSGLSYGVVATATNVSTTVAVVQNSYRDISVANCYSQAYEVAYTLGSLYVRQGTLATIGAGPTTAGYGTWIVGDQVWNSTPAQAGTIGWVCITGGAPGVWAAMTTATIGAQANF